MNKQVGFRSVSPSRTFSEKEREKYIKRKGIKMIVRQLRAKKKGKKGKKGKEMNSRKKQQEKEAKKEKRREKSPENLQILHRRGQFPSWNQPTVWFPIEKHEQELDRNYWRKNEQWMRLEKRRRRKWKKNWKGS
jgi:hypothetical protein